MTESTFDAGRLIDTETGEVIPVDPGTSVALATADPVAGTVAAAGGRELTPFQAQIEHLLAPHTIDVQEWAEALFEVREFPEADPDEQSMSMLAQILTAGTSAEALASMELNRAKELCGDEPGGHSPLLLITSARPIKSDYEDGPPVYAIVEATVKASGETIRFTTGARHIQAVLLAHIGNGWMPFEGILSIRSQKTKRGYYPLNLTAGG